MLFVPPDKAGLNVKSLPTVAEPDRFRFTVKLVVKTWETEQGPAPGWAG